MARKLIMMGGVAPGASVTPLPGDQKKHSKKPGLKGAIFCKIGNKFMTVAGKTRQS